jgi:hypothetical protein
MLFSMDSDVSFPGVVLLLYVLKGPSDLGLCCTGHIPHIVGPKEVVKQEHISVPSIPVTQIRLDVNTTRVFATNIGHYVPNLAPVIHKGSSRVRRSCGIFLFHSFIDFRRVFSFWLDLDVWAHNIIQCFPSYSILRGKVLPDCLQSSWPILVINHRFFYSILETNFMMLLVATTADQHQVDCIGNGLTLEYIHVFQIIQKKLQVIHCPDGDRYTIVT